MVLRGTVGGEVDELDALAEVLGRWAHRLSTSADEVARTLERLRATRSEGLEGLSDHGAAVAWHGSSVVQLSERARTQALKFRRADSGAAAGVGRPPVYGRPAPARVYGPPAPARVYGPPAPLALLGRGRPGNWADLDPGLIAAGWLVAESLRRRQESSDLSEAEVTKLAAWWWAANQRGEERVIRRVVGGLSMRDLEAVRRIVALFDWNAFDRVSRLVPAGIEDVMTLLAAPGTGALSATQLSGEIRRRLHVSDPVVLDAIAVYLRYQIGTARHAADGERERHGELIWGWFVPSLAPAWWAKLLALDDYGMRAVGPAEVGDKVNVIVGAIGGEALRLDDRRLVAMAEAVARGGVPLAILTGIGVGAMVAVAFPESAVAGSLVAALEAIGMSASAATITGTLLAAMVGGAVSGLAGGVGQRIVDAISGRIDWDDVLAPDTIARDAMLGGLMSMTKYSLLRGVSATASKIAATRAVGRSTVQLEKDLAALERAINVTEVAHEVLTAKTGPPPKKAAQPTPRCP